MTATKPRDSQNPGHQFATAKSMRRGGSPPAPIEAQLDLQREYRRAAEGCTASVLLGARDPLPAGWCVASTTTAKGPDNVRYFCQKHSPLRPPRWGGRKARKVRSC